MEYKIVKDTLSFSLEKKVNDLLNEGWEPIGGVSFNDDYYYQALIRR